MSSSSPNRADGDGPHADQPGPSSALKQVQREQERLYVDLAARMPRWYFLALGGLVAVNLGSFDLGLGLAQVAVNQLSLIALIVLVVTLRRRTGITGLRLRKLPAGLRQAFLPLAAFGLVVLPLVGVVLWLGISDPHRAISFTSLGVACGLGLVLAGIWSWRRFAVEADRLAGAAGADR